jgi:ComF family protein
MFSHFLPLQDLYRLFFPALCPACQSEVLAPKSILCPTCHVELPYTQQATEADNAFCEKFWGRLPLEHGAALLLFSKGGRVQHLIHKIKYEGRQELALQLGRMLGERLRQSPDFQDIDLVSPIPLHPRRLRWRGYNQAACLAQGIAETLQKPFEEEALARVQFKKSQTRKGRIERLKNVQESFVVKNPDLLLHKHVLLVDDVLTTGATLEACALPILEVEGTKISMATLAMAI